MAMIEEEIVIKKENDCALFDFIEKHETIKVIESLKKKVDDFLLMRDSNGMNALQRVCYLNFHDIIVSSLEHLSVTIDEGRLQAFINEQTPKGMTSLHYASYKGNIFAIELLIKHKADVTSLSSKGYSMLHLAAMGNQPEAIILFKDKYKLNLYALDNQSNSALHLAAFNKSTLAVNFLLSWKFQINAQNAEGYTPLHFAVIDQNEKMIKKLLHNGANRDVKDKYDRTAVDFSMNTGNARIFSILKRKTYIQRLCCFPEVRKHQYNLGDISIFMFFYFLFASFVLIALLPVLNRTVYVILYCAVLFIIFGLYLATSCSNTATRVRKEERPLLELIEKGDDVGSFCPFCMIHKTKAMKHCVICNKCIDGFDHHCFFFVNCIASRNLILFYVFLVVAILFSMVCIVIIILCYLSPNEDLPYDALRIPFMIQSADWLYFTTTKLVICSLALPYYAAIEGMLLMFFGMKIKGALCN